MSYRKSIIAVSVTVAILLCLVDALIDYKFFYHESLANLLFLKVPPAELFTRGYLVVLTILFGLFTIRLTDSLKAGRTSDDLYRSLIESTAAIPWEIDLKSLRFTYIGPRVEELSGYPPEQWINSEFWAARVHPNDRETAVNYRQTASSRGENHEFNYRLIKADGGIIWIRDIAFVSSENDQPSMMRGFFFDITKFKDVELEKQKLESQLRQAQKMEAIGQLAGGIAHDFNNYLMTIMGFGELLLMNFPEKHPNRSNLDEILGAADKASALTRSLLAFSRKQVMDPRPVDLNEVIERIGKIITRLLGEEINLRFKPAPGKIIVKADQGQLEQVIMNMAANAKDAMANGGDFLIEVTSLTIDQEYIDHHGYGKPGPYGEIKFADSGTGMDSRTSEKIFEPFYTTKEKGKGTGLGMSIVHGIVKQHEGFISLTSEIGRGSTFRVLLPCLPNLVEKRIGQTPPLTEALQESNGNEIILLAEDEEAVRRLLTTILEEAGYEVIQTVDGNQAIAEYNSARRQIALLILDVIMPNKSGKEVMDHVQKLDPDARILLISGYTDEIIHSKGILDKELDFLTKPILPHQLLKKVRQILDR